MLLRILQASGKATEFLASVVMEEVKNLGKTLKQSRVQCTAVRTFCCE